jgi:hypothetical protein
MEMSTGRRRPSELPGGTRTRSGRNSPPIDSGTLALAISGMTFYWMLPALKRAQRAQQRKAAPPPQTPPQA